MQNDTPRLLRDYTKDFEAVLAKRTHLPELPLITLNSVNRIIWGLPKGKMTVIAGRTSNGKTNMAINIAYDLAKQGHPILFFSLEMSCIAIYERIYCYEKQVPNTDIQRGRSGAYDTQFQEFKKTIDKIPFVIGDSLGRTIKDIHDYLIDLPKKPEAVFIDHIQEIDSADKDKKDTIDKYLKHMRELAIRNNFALVCCSQINRMGQAEKDIKPKLHQLKGSGAIEEMADLCLLLFWNYHYDKAKPINSFELNIAKNREGMTGFVDLIYKPEFCRFEDMPIPQKNWNEKEE